MTARNRKGRREGREEGGRESNVKASQTRANTGNQCQTHFHLQLPRTNHAHYLISGYLVRFAWLFQNGLSRVHSHGQPVLGLFKRPSRDLYLRAFLRGMSTLDSSFSAINLLRMDGNFPSSSFLCFSFEPVLILNSMLLCKKKEKFTWRRTK